MSSNKSNLFDLSKEEISETLSDISEEEITEVLESMVEKGYLRAFIKDGERVYEITEEGKLARDHSDSDPKLRN
jgi:DNA-binding PadR family transcriptional regulator